MELHHIGQKSNGPLAELTESEHRKIGNNTVLHNKKKHSEIDRINFNKQRKKYWKTRLNIRS